MPHGRTETARQTLIDKLMVRVMAYGCRSVAYLCHTRREPRFQEVEMNIRFSPVLGALLLALLPPAAFAGPIVFEASGSDASAIQATVDAFRFALGSPNNGNNSGPLASGRREINWDGGGATTTAAAGPASPVSRTRVARCSRRRAAGSSRRFSTTSSTTRYTRRRSAPSARVACSRQSEAT